MSPDDIIRSWKRPTTDPLAAAAESASPNPAGRLMLEDELGPVNGAATEYLFTIGCCSGFTNFNSTCTCTWGPSCPTVGCRSAVDACH